MALLLQDLDRLAEAELLHCEVLAGYRETVGDKHPSTLSSIFNMVILLVDLGKPAEAELLCREAYKGFRSQFGQRHPRTVKSAHWLGRLLWERGEDAEAAPLLAMSLEVCALPSCGRGHAVGIKLKHCTGCDSVMYCCPVRARGLVARPGLPIGILVCPPALTLDPIPVAVWPPDAGAPAGALEDGVGRPQGGMQTA